MTTQEVIDYFNKLDQKQGNIVHDTEKGIFGVSDLQIIKGLLEQLSLKETDQFVDLGSGDGRVVLLAQNYCQSTGIEFDKQLVEQSNNHKEQLQSKATFREEDYENYDYSKITVLFSFADHFFSEQFIKKLKQEFKGTLYIYQGVFTPNGLKKGKTIWVNQVPIYTYTTS